MNVWFLTIVQDGHVSLTSIIQDTKADAIDAVLRMTESLGFTYIEIERMSVSDSINVFTSSKNAQFKATLIKS